MNNTQLDANQLIQIVERIERLESEAKQVAEGIKEVYEEAKSAGYDPKYIKQCIKLRAKDPNELAEEDELLQMYREALGI
jgi:uncharacterized protein (UPF0335 family)